MIHLEDFKVTFEERIGEDLIRFFCEVWPNLSEEERRERLRWRYELNPFSEKPFISLAICHGKITGFRAFVPQMVRVGNCRTEVFCPSDALVHPDYRRKGVFSLLTNASLEELEHRKMGYILSLSSNGKSSEANLKMGWVQTNSVKSYGYKFSLSALINQKVIKRRLNRKRIIKITKTNCALFISEEINITEIINFRSRYPVDDSIIIERNHDYYNWIYFQQAADFYYCQLSESDEMSAYIILKKVSDIQFSIYEYHSSSSKSLKRLLKLVQRRLKIPILRLVLFNINQKKYARAIGMKLETPELMMIMRKKRFPVLLRSIVKTPSEKDYYFCGKDVRDMNNWTLYASDIH